MDEDNRNPVRTFAGHIEDGARPLDEDDPRDENDKKLIAESHEKKRMFICCDGTWQNASGTMTPLTNVAKLARAVDRLGRDVHVPAKMSVCYRERGNQEKTRFGLVRQIVYYSSGIGGQTALNIERGFSGLTGKGLTSNILNAYCFICNNFNFASELDEIILLDYCAAKA
ncbi:hypothetical protein CKAH01_08708 [Colletotrichum kahawae]|uniref:T6SS Phospholipase effector Tle1-like catalytic domain-containing protein n=1 Tax=Colletotrichum kahawae TaxID=34407 RepID=A0AAE0CZW3_COLKA|nr:hypothetical protein CKAH01_08708 [Colletotrichum kahawae]